jgi:hypothetical protein
MGKYASISSDGPSNKKIEIDLKMDLKDKENRENQINIEFDGIIKRSVIKMIKLNNGDLALALYMCNKILLFKNLKEEKNPLVEEEEDIQNFIQLNNNKVVIVFNHKIKIYNFVNQSLILETKISFNDGYYNGLIRKIDMNNFAFLSYNNDNGYSLFLCKYPLYKIKEIKFSIKAYKGDFIQMDNIIIICFRLSNSLNIFFYNLDNQKLDYIDIKHLKTQKAEIKCFKINKDKILVSTNHCGLIVNIKVKQVETFLPKFKNIYCIGKMDKFLLAIRNRSISEINFKKYLLFNEHKINFDYPDNKELSNSDFSLINLENNKFCVLYDNDCILFKYH